MYDKERYERLKSEGICPNCGKPNDRANRVYCTECQKRRNEKNLETRKWYAKIRYCPRCQKNKLFGSEKVCPECNAENTNRIERKREISREKYNEYMKDYHKQLYNQRKADGICTRCGKVSVKGTGYYTCIKCREKERKNIYPREYGWARVAEGRCFFCGEPVKKGYKVCEKHWKSNCENAKKADRSYLQRTNKLFFRKKVKCVNEKENPYLDCADVTKTEKE